MKYRIIIKNPDENKNEMFGFTGFLTLFYGKFQFFSPLWNETVFATSSIHAIAILKLVRPPFPSWLCSTTSAVVRGVACWESLEKQSEYRAGEESVAAVSNFC